MLFVSTRGQTGKVSAAHAIKEGLAGDGGLFVPQSFPYFPWKRFWVCMHCPTNSSPPKY